MILRGKLCWKILNYCFIHAFKKMCIEQHYTPDFVLGFGEPDNVDLKVLVFMKRIF